MLIPSYLMNDSMEVEPFLGQFSQGMSYGPKVTISNCFIEDQVTLQRDKNGQEVVSSARVFVQNKDANVPLDSRVTINGRETTVLNIKKHDLHGKLPVPEHLEVILA